MCRTGKAPMTYERGCIRISPYTDVDNIGNKVKLNAVQLSNLRQVLVFFVIFYTTPFHHNSLL